jgi:hypothetical protein
MAENISLLATELPFETESIMSRTRNFLRCKIGQAAVYGIAALGLTTATQATTEQPASATKALNTSSKVLALKVCGCTKLLGFRVELIL